MKEECRQFEARLGDFLEGSLSLQASDDARKHMAACRKCRGLYEIAVGELDLLAPGVGRSLAGKILRKTTGPACRRALDRMGDFIEGTLASAEARDFSVHLRNCSSCPETFRILNEMRLLFPQMAQVQPGAGFTEEVLAATTRRRAPGGRDRAKARRWWMDLVHRPRLAWEVAYLATLLLLLTVGNPALMSMDILKGGARSAWIAAAFRLERISTASLAGAEQTAARVSESIGERHAAAEKSLGGLWDRSTKLTAKALALDKATVGRLMSRIRTVLLDIARALGLDRTFSQAMRYLEWVR